MIQLINVVPDDVETILVVGHEPTMSMTALGLADPDRGDFSAAERISAKYPTSSIAVLRTAQPWSRLELGSAELIAFHVAR